MAAEVIEKCLPAKVRSEKSHRMMVALAFARRTIQQQQRALTLQYEGARLLPTVFHSAFLAALADLALCIHSSTLQI